MRILPLVTYLTAAVLCGCVTSDRLRPSEVPASGGTPGSQEVGRTVAQMVDSMLADEAVLQEIGGKWPVLDVVGLKNRSSVQMDMDLLTSEMRIRLIRTRMFRFADRTMPGFEAQMSLYGELSEVSPTGGEAVETSDASAGRVVRIDLSLKDLLTDEIVWADEREIRRERTPCESGR